MEDIPPSYHQSTNPSVLDMIAPYLDTPSLHTLTLVSRAFNETFMPHLWGSPAAHFVSVTGPASPGMSQTLKHEASYNDLVYVALTRFKRILRFARESTRLLTHTLYLPAANSEIYSGPNATWLREILDGLPNLQSLCVSGLPFFDHHSLVAVDRSRASQSDRLYRTYPVKLLLAAKEANTTSPGLSLLLPHLSSLVYLDLSYTTAARDINVLSSFSALNDLRVLKLRGIGLRDMEGETLANAIGLRVRLLDIADNFLGDMGVRSLLQACFSHPTTTLSTSNQAGRNRGTYPPVSDHHSRRHLESWPVGLPPAPDFLSLDTLRSADFDRNLLVQLTNPLTGRLAFEDIPHSGLTHLYISGNPAVTVEGVKGLLEIGRLHVLDAADIAGETVVDKYVQSVRKRRVRTKSIGSGGASGTASRHSGGRAEAESDEGMFDDDIHLPGAEKLIPILKEKASGNLTYLRIEHSIVTKRFDGPKETESKADGRAELAAPLSQPSELSNEPGVTVRVEAPGSNHHAVEAPGSRHFAAELPSNPDVFELDSTGVFRAELPGDPIHFAISPPIGDRPEAKSPELPISPIRGEGAYAPEVAESDADRSSDKHSAGLEVLNPDTLHRSISPISVPSPMVAPRVADGPLIDTVVKAQMSPSSDRRTSSSSNHESQLQKLLETRPSPKSPLLHPSSLPNLRTLILTNVPAEVTSISSPVFTYLRDFITACASEAYIAILRARTDYSLPPGRARAAAELKHARGLFALRTIVLEMSPVQDSRPRDWKHTRQRLNISKSSTGDHDSEALWSAAENDFSFFGEAGEEHDECGIYDHEPGKYFPSVHLDDKFAILADDASGTTHGSSVGRGGLQSSTGTIFRSPRELPLGRNRRSSAEIYNRDSPPYPSSPRLMELPGTVPTSQPRQLLSPTSVPRIDQDRPAPMVDLVSELSKWRRERKAAYEAEVRRRSRVNGVTANARLADSEAYVEGHWKGEIQVIRNSKPSRLVREQGRLERTGKLDVYGNYFEDGYRYS